MPFLRSMPEGALIHDVHARRPERMKNWFAVTDDILRGPSDLPQTFRQLVSCYISALNACQYCHGTHRRIAIAFGYEPDVLDALMEDVDTAPIEDRYKPVLKYLRKLTETPSRLTQADADAVYDAGWDEQALSDIVYLGAMWAFVNRVAQGHGLEALPDDVQDARAQLIIDKTDTGANAQDTAGA